MEIAEVIIQALITLIKLNYAIGQHAKSAKFEFQIDSGTLDSIQTFLMHQKANF